MSTMVVPTLEFNIVPNVTTYFPEYVQSSHDLPVLPVDQTFSTRGVHLNTPGIADVGLEVFSAANIALEVTL